MGIICPTCGEKARTIETKYGIRNNCCDLWSWGDDAPLVSKETHDARQAAHKSFDQIWKSGKMKRREAYTRLGEIMCLRPEDCHMKLMDAVTAKKVPYMVKKITADL